MSLVFCLQTVIEFRLVPEDMSVVESNTEVEVCIVLIGTLGRDVEVTVVTGPKSGALNQATGIASPEILPLFNIKLYGLAHSNSQKFVYYCLCYLNVKF